MCTLVRIATRNAMSRTFSERLHAFSRSALRASLFSIPYIWLFVFLCIPFAILLGISFCESTIRIPPYTNLWKQIGPFMWSLRLNIGNYVMLFNDPLYILAYLNSLKIAFFATFFCVLLAYPAAYGIVQLPQPWRFRCVVLVMLPFWITFLVRMYAWVGLMSSGGALCRLFQFLGLLKADEVLVGTPLGVLIGLVYTYLPFMFLPLYNALEKIDKTLIEVALDLGCPPHRVFWRLIVPLSWRGMLTGAILVFIPVIGEFTVPELLGGNKVLMIGQVVWGEFFHTHDWPAACALAIAMLATLIPPVLVLSRLQGRGHT